MRRRYHASRLFFAVSALAFSLALRAGAADGNVVVVVPPPGISFASLTGPDGSPYLGHTEGDFVVTPTTTDWFKSITTYGNPVPSIYLGPLNSPGVGVVQITDSVGLFRLSAFDYSSNNGNQDNSLPTVYDIQGFLGPNLQYEETGSLMNSFSPFSFNTLTTANPSVLVDALLIELIPGQHVTSVNLDNIRVATVPEPSSLLLVACGLAGLLHWRKAARR
jgi:hypothetical protein